MAPTPSDKALVPFVSVDHMMQLIHDVGIGPMLRGLTDYIEEDFRRWDLFDKTPRVASHSAEGVIELMPTSDGEVYGFKYVNGHPENTQDGLQTVTAFGLLADVATGYPVLLSEMTMAPSPGRPQKETPTKLLKLSSRLASAAGIGPLS